MEYRIDCSNAATKRFIEMLLPNLLTQLRLNSSRKLLHIIVDKDIQEHGVTLDLTPANGTLLVVLKPSKNMTEIGMTLAHELVHVKQMARGLLKYGSRGSVFWCGKRYGKNTKYTDCPWEIQAFSKQELLFRRAMEE
jgi:hypothetical protein